MTLQTYTHKFTHLNANKNRSHWTAVTTHRAPHKPILLLSVIDLFAQGHIRSNLIGLDEPLYQLLQQEQPRNGLALFRLCHWSFDEGLVTLTNSYQIQISPQLAAPDNIPGHLSAFGRRPFLGPTDQTLWPFPEAIAWHQQTLFRSR